MSKDWRLHYVVLLPHASGTLHVKLKSVAESAREAARPRMRT